MKDIIFYDTKYEGYKVDNLGNVYSQWVTGKKPYIDENKFKKLKFGINQSGKGYYSCSIRISEYKYKTMMVHRFVYDSIVGITDPKLTVSHLDGNRYNNCIDNLALESQSDNLKRKFKHGTLDIGYNNSRAKINKEQYLEIKKLLEQKNLTHEKIGEMFGVNRVFITKINRGNRYGFDNHI
jgi:predicted XRE-type DNA-binding protein